MAAMMIVRVTVSVGGKSERFVFEGAPSRQLGTADARRLWEAERAFKDLTDLDVQVELVEANRT